MKGDVGQKEESATEVRKTALRPRKTNSTERKAAKGLLRLSDADELQGIDVASFSPLSLEDVDVVASVIECVLISCNG